MNTAVSHRIRWAPASELSAAGGYVAGSGREKVVGRAVQAAMPQAAPERKPVQVEVTPERLDPGAANRPAHLLPIVSVIARISPTAASVVVTNERAWAAALELDNRNLIADQVDLVRVDQRYVLDPTADPHAEVVRSLGFEDQTDREAVLAGEVRHLMAVTAQLRREADQAATKLAMAQGAGPETYRSDSFSYVPRAAFVESRLG